MKALDAEVTGLVEKRSRSFTLWLCNDRLNFYVYALRAFFNPFFFACLRVLPRLLNGIYCINHAAAWEPRVGMGNKRYKTALGWPPRWDPDIVIHMYLVTSLNEVSEYISGRYSAYTRIKMWLAIGYQEIIALSADKSQRHSNRLFDQQPRNTRGLSGDQHSKLLWCVENFQMVPLTQVDRPVCARQWRRLQWPARQESTHTSHKILSITEAVCKVLEGLRLKSVDMKFSVRSTYRVAQK